jgi:PAS domain S-box-containing protein
MPKMQIDSGEPPRLSAIRRLVACASRRPPLLHLIAFFAAYIFGAGIGQGLAIIPGISVTFWPPSGIFLATLLWNSRSVWLWFVAAGCLAELTCNFCWFQNPIVLALVYFSANSLEAIAAAVLIRTFTSQPFRLETFEEVGNFVIWGAGLAPMVGATIIAATDALLGKHSFAAAWPMVWLGDSSGLLVSTPLTFVAIQLWRERGDTSKLHIIEASVVFGVLLGVGKLSFAGYLPSAYVMLPPLLWAAARFQLKGAASALGLITLITAESTLTGQGEFAGSPVPARADIIMLQTFLAISALSGLIVAVLSQQHQQALDSLRRVNSELEARVTERTASLQESEARLRLFVENAPASIAMFDRNRQHLMASRRWKEMNSLDDEQTVGRADSTAFPDISEEWTEVFQRALMGSVQCSPGDRFISSDGTEKWLKWEVIPWLNSENEIGGVLIATEDITDVKRHEMALRDSEAKFRTLADNMSQFAWMADEQGAIFWYNQRWYDYSGTTLDQMEGWGWRAIHHPDHVDRVAGKVSECFAQGLDWEDTFPLRGRDGEYRWFLSRAVPIRDSNGKVVRWFGTNTDVTDLRRIEAELETSRKLAEEANRAKSDFLANMSHEIRSPMTSILGYLDLLHLVEDQDREKIETIRRNGNYLIALINDILDLSRIEAGKLEADPVEFSPRKLVDDVMSLMSVRAGESSLELKHAYPNPIPARITSDPTRIRQILINLVSNAIKFTENGSVDVNVLFDPHQSTLRFEVRDTGIGISAEQLERLFLPFEQADTTIARRFGGSGLGLAISHRLASLLGGSIEVTSEVGRGSQFAFVLPVDRQVTLETPTEMLSIASPVAQPRMLPDGKLELRVLVVDDRRDVRFLANHFLIAVGCTTVQCENGEEAIAQIEHARQQGIDFDIVLMDVQMPVMDGVSTVRKLRREGFSRPIIALTANAMNSDREMCLDAGYTDWLTKPIDKHQLIETLRRHVSSTS